MALDRFARRVHYLRIGLTDRCNLRCVYCMPEAMTFRPRAELMQNNELFALVDLFARLGFDKMRLTGGEPTVRDGIVDVVRRIGATPGVRSLSMTTNGVRLKDLAEPMAQAGLQRVNVSVDSLDPVKFRRLTRWGDLDDVWQGLQAAERAGLTPIKLNAVVVRGYNDGVDLVELARLTLEHAWQVRFIEMMPFAGLSDFQRAQVVGADEMRTTISAALGPVEPIDGARLDGEASLYRLEGASGELGFISSITEPFCASCNRARLTADGKLRLCLLREFEVDLLTPLRAGASLEELERLVLDGVWYKPWGHGLAEDVIPLDRVMSEIGG